MDVINNHLFSNYVLSMNFSEKRSRVTHSFGLDLSQVREVYGALNKKMRLHGWTTQELENGNVLVVRYENGIPTKEGYVLNRDQILRIIGYEKRVIVVLKQVENAITGLHFKGFVRAGVPFGRGSLYNCEGVKLFDGIVINWKQIGWGISYHEDGSKEYEGYWCNGCRCGYGTLYNNTGKMIYQGDWINGKPAREDYFDDDLPLNTRMKSLRLTVENQLSEFCSSSLPNLETLYICSNCFESVSLFCIDGLQHLRKIQVEENCFKKSGEKVSYFRSFQVMHCPVLQSIVIGSESFRNFGNVFSLKDLPQLSVLQIGDYCFRRVSKFVLDELPSLRELRIGSYSFTEDRISEEWDWEKVPDRSRSFHVTNCAALSSIHIDVYSFSDYDGEFELRYLPSLAVLSIGAVDEESFNFRFTPFVVRSRTESRDRTKISPTSSPSFWATTPSATPSTSSSRVGETSGLSFRFAQSRAAGRRLLCPVGKRGSQMLLGYEK